MKKTFYIFVTLLCLVSLQALAQTPTKEYKIGKEFQVNIPDYMIRTSGLNSSAAFQFKNDDKDVFGFIIQDSKDELTSVGLTFNNTDSFYNFFITDFIKDADKRTVSTPIHTKKESISFIESDFSYMDSETKVEIYYFIGIVETKSCYYKVLCCSSLANKEKFKAEFRSILYSLKD